MEITLEDLNEWIQALTSGAVTQVTGELHRHGFGMCCLGVLARLHAEKLSLEVRVDEDGAVWYGEGQACLPRKLADAFRVDDVGPVIPQSALTEEDASKLKDRIYYRARYDTRGIHASEMNDGGLSFKRIAELLPYGVVVIDNYQDRNVLKPWGQPLV